MKKELKEKVNERSKRYRKNKKEKGYVLFTYWVKKEDLKNIREVIKNYIDNSSKIY